MSFHLPTTEDKADYVLNQFNRVAQRYDLANDAISLGMHRLWKKKAIEALEMKPDGQYLDVCCGTGDLTLRIVENLSPFGSVIGLDFAANMLEVARMRAAMARARLASVSFIEGDALNLPFADHYFDGAIISFGLRNLTDLQRGLSQMARVVKPGGKVVNLDLGHPTNLIFKPIYHFYFSQIVPIIGQILQGNKIAYTYLPASLNTYPRPEGITSLFAAAGLKDIKHIPLAFGSVALHIGTCDGK